jgi:hypothetical protein
MIMKPILHIVFAGLLATTLTHASIPLDKELEQIHFRVRALKENPDSNLIVDALFEDIENLAQEYGIDGVAWAAYREPVLLETFIAPQSFGLENISVSLIRQAQDRVQLTDMIEALVLAQLFINMDPESPKHLEYFEEGARLSKVALSDVELEQLVIEAVAKGIETGRLEVRAAHAKHLNTAATLMSVGKVFFIPVNDGIIISSPIN